MLVLIEGADGTGKTTLARELCEQYGFKYLKFGVPDKHPMRYWFEKLVEVHEPTVIDRMHLSEEVYGPVFRKGSQLSYLDWQMAEGWLWARRTVLVMCSTSWEAMQRNQEKVDGEYHGEKQKLVVEKFKDLLVNTTLPLTIYDYRTPITRLLVDRLIHAVHQGPAVDFETQAIGTLRPRVWLVGDRANMNGVPYLGQMTFYSTSGEYLMHTLDVAGLDLSDVHISNAYDENERMVDLLAQWFKLGNPRVIALGQMASSALGFKGVEHTRVSHPQFVRRFHHHDMEGYASELLRAAGL